MSDTQYPVFREPEKNKYEPAILTEREKQIKRDLAFIASELKRLEERRANLLQACQHKAFYDVPGMPYDVRMCAICGAKLETI